MIGYAGCSTDKQDLTAQHDRLVELGVAEKHIYLDQALAAVRDGRHPRRTETRPARPPSATSWPPAASDSPSTGRSTTPQTLRKMFFNILEVDLLPQAHQRRMAVARAKGRLRGKQPKLSAKQLTELQRMHATGDYSITDLAELFTVGRATQPKRAQ